MTSHHADPAELEALLTLRFTPGLGPLRTEVLLRAYRAATAVLSAPRAELRATAGLSASVLDALGGRESRERAARELAVVRSRGYGLLGRGLPGYPAALEALPDPPVLLWTRGELPALDVVPRAVGVVGTREASPFALDFTRRLTLDLVRADVVIVSGLARGVDTVAHASALEGGGVTLAVLGCGVDRTYPPENVALARRLTVVSEHPPGTPPAAHHFPGRNRVIAALAAGSVVVEGRARSGAMITASASLDCGRTVFAVPGRAGDPLAEGPNRLIREGAVIVESAADVFAELGWSPAPPAAAPTLAPDLVEVFAALDTQPRLLDDVALTAGVTASAAQAALTRLLLAGLVEQGAGGRYRLRS